MSLWRRMLIIISLSAAAVTDPILDIYGRNPEVFVANRTSPMDIVLFSLIVSLAVPAVTYLILLVAIRIGGRAPGHVFTAIVAVLSFALGFVVSRQVFPGSGWAAIAMGLFVAFLIRRFEAMFVWFAIALPVVFIMFISASASAKLVWVDSEPASGEFAIADPAPVLLIQLDEFPTASIMDANGGVNEALFPNFARLSTEGTWYRNAMSNSIATTQSVPAVLTGTLKSNTVPFFDDHPENLFTLLSGVYEMHVIEWITGLCPDDICPDYGGRAPPRFSSLLVDVGIVYGHLSLPPTLREKLPSIDNTWNGFLGQNARPSRAGIAIDGLPIPTDGTVVNWAIWIQRIVNGLGEGNRPVLSFVHVEAPHVPWRTNPSGTHYERPEEYHKVEGVGGDGRWGSRESPTLFGFQRHLYQLGFLDKMVGRMLDKLDATGTLDETMVVVVADHGASFTPGEHRRWPYEDNRTDLYRVPLFVKYPHQDSGSINDDPVYGIDILPTIVDVLGVDVDWEFDGISLRDVEGSNRPHEVLWWCCNGGPADTDIESLMDQVEANFERIPEQRSWLSVAGVGPDAGLIGLPVSSLRVEHADGLFWSLEWGAELADTDLGRGKVQTLWEGRIEMRGGIKTQDVLFVVNGTVGGMGYVRRDHPEGGTFIGMVAEELINDGRNELDVLVPNGSGKWLSGAADVLQLEFSTADGRVLDLQAEGGRRLQISKVTPSETGWRLKGWSADVTQKVTADMLHVFGGDELILSSPPNQDDKNVVRRYHSDDLLRSGFAFDIEAADIPVGIERLTVVAEFGDFAIAEPVPLIR